MAAGHLIRRNPSTDQKRDRRMMARQAADESDSQAMGDSEVLETDPQPTDAIVAARAAMTPGRTAAASMHRAMSSLPNVGDVLIDERLGRVTVSSIDASGIITAVHLRTQSGYRYKVAIGQVDKGRVFYGPVPFVGSKTAAGPMRPADGGLTCPKCGGPADGWVVENSDGSKTLEAECESKFWEAGNPGACTWSGTKTMPAKAASSKTAARGPWIRVVPSVGSYSGSPMFTVELMGDEDSIGYGVWEPLFSTLDPEEARSRVREYISQGYSLYSSEGGIPATASKTASSSNWTRNGKNWILQANWEYPESGDYGWVYEPAGEWEIRNSAGSVLLEDVEGTVTDAKAKVEYWLARRATTPPGENWMSSRFTTDAKRKTSTRKTAWSIDEARKVVDTQSYSTVDGQTLDLFSASGLVQIYDALSPENQAKFTSLSLGAAVDVAFKLINKHSSTTTITPKMASSFVTDYFAAVDGIGKQLMGAQSVSTVLSIAGDFWGGSGDELMGILSDSGWRIVEAEADYHWSMRAPDGSILGYIEGDLQNYTEYEGRLASRKTAGNGPNGFWCRFCGDYQSIRNKGELRAMEVHMEAHKAAGDAPLPVLNGFPTKGSLRAEDLANKKSCQTCGHEAGMHYGGNGSGCDYCYCTGLSVAASRKIAGGPYHEWVEVIQTVGVPSYERTAYEYQDEYAKVTVSPFQRTEGVTEGWMASVTQTAMPGYSWGTIGQSSSYGPFPTKMEAMQAGIAGIESRGLSSIGSTRRTASPSSGSGQWAYAFFEGYGDAESDRVTYPYIPDSVSADGYRAGVSTQRRGDPMPGDILDTANRYMEDSDRNWEADVMNSGGRPYEDSDDIIMGASRRNAVPDGTPLSKRTASDDPNEEEVEGLATDQTWLDNEEQWQVDASRSSTHANFYEWREDDGQWVHRIDIGRLDSEGILQVVDTFVTDATSMDEAIDRYDPDESLIWDEPGAPPRGTNYTRASRHGGTVKTAISDRLAEVERYVEQTWGGSLVMKSYPDFLINVAADHGVGVLEAFDTFWAEEVPLANNPTEAWMTLRNDGMSREEALTYITGDVYTIFTEGSLYGDPDAYDDDYTYLDEAEDRAYDRFDEDRAREKDEWDPKEGYLNAAMPRTAKKAHGLTPESDLFI